MDLGETYRLITGLRRDGWDDKRTCGLICWVSAGERTYLHEPPAQVEKTQ